MSKDFIAAFGKDVNLSQADELIKQDFTVRELIQEDWRDFVAAFFFPNLSKCITDPKVKAFIQSINSELLEKGQ